MLANDEANRVKRFDYVYEYKLHISSDVRD